MRIVGIDPGYSGGLALVKDGKLWETHVMPTVKLKGHKRDIDEEGLVELLDKLMPDHVYLEWVSAMPKQGVVSMFNFGTGWGVVRGTLTALGYPYTLVRPRVWQAVMFADVDKQKKPKQKARLAAKKLWPGHNWKKSHRSSVDHEGMLDAALIAFYGAQKQQEDETTESETT